MVVSSRKVLPAAAKVLACSLALGAGALTGRYTDLGRSTAKAAQGAQRASSEARSPAAPEAPEAEMAQAPAPATAEKHEPPANVEPPVNDAVLYTATATRALEAVIAEPSPTPPSDTPQGPTEDEIARGLMPELKNGAIMTGVTPHRLILFTFDDGPDRNTTPLLLDRLDAAGVRAVFFLTGANLRGENLAQRKNQQIAREAMARGHFLASHSMNHKQLPLLNDQEVLQEVTETEQVFERVLGARPWLIRPPGGAHSPRVDRLLSARGYTTMLWNLGAGDFQVRTAKDVHDTWRKVFERREAEGQRGGIILLHDTYSWSVDAFQLIVQDILDRNCKLLARGEELYDFVDDPGLFFEALGERTPNTQAGATLLTEEQLEARQAPLREETRQRCNSMARL